MMKLKSSKLILVFKSKYNASAINNKMFWQSLKRVILIIKGPSLIEEGDAVSNQSEFC